jgi:ATP-dependent protease Clp ATPase subunit
MPVVATLAELSEDALVQSTCDLKCGGQAVQQTAMEGVELEIRPSALRYRPQGLSS